MRLIYPRILSAATVAALVLSTFGIASLASAEAGGPTVTLTSTSAATTSAATIPVAVAFSDSVTGFASSSVTVTNATVTNFSGSGASYTFDLVPTADGTVTVAVPADVATGVEPPEKDNQASNTLTFTWSAAADPTITGVSVTPGASTATVTWTTNVPTTGQVFFGTTTGYGASTTLEVTESTSHSATLLGLSASTTYHFQIEATDEDGNATTTGDATFTTTAAAPLAPVISDIAVSGIATSTATVTWTTDVAASSQVMYGTTTGYGSSTTLDTTATTSHSVMLSGLQEATLYHFQVASANGAGTTTSSDQTFTSGSTASSTPLAVTGVDAVKTDATADDTFLHGWEWIMHLTVPDTEDAFRMKFSDFTMSGSSSTIPAANNIRIFSPQSTNATSEGTAVMQTSNNYGAWLYLNGDTATTTAGRQIDVTIQVRVPSGTAAGAYTTTYGAQSVPSSATSTTP